MALRVTHANVATRGAGKDWWNAEHVVSGSSGIDVTLPPFNAKGDGVTDDTAAIQAAIDAAEATGGGTAYVPVGTYKITASLTIQADSVSLVGAGFGSVLSASVAITGSVVSVGIASPGLINFNQIRDLKIVLTHDTAVGIALTRAIQPVIDHVSILGSEGASETEIGILVDGSSIWASGLRMTNCSIFWVKTGLKLSNLTTACHIIGNWFGGHSTAYAGSTNLLIDSTSGSGTSIVANAFNNADIGIDNDGEWQQILGNRFEGIAVYGIKENTHARWYTHAGNGYAVGIDNFITNAVYGNTLDLWKPITLGVNGLSIATTGDVSIGEDSGASLEVNKAATYTGPAVDMVTLAHSATWNLRIQADWPASNGQINYRLVQNAGGSDRTLLRFYGGNIGIGVDVPVKPLDIVGDVGVDGALAVTDPTTIDGTIYSSRKGANSDGDNLWIGGGGASSIGDVAATTKGSVNVAIGKSSQLAATTGKDNVAVGPYSLYANTTAARNTGIGGSALGDLNITADNNTGNNTAVGYNSGRGIVTGLNNTILGANVTGLDAALAANIILAIGTGAIKAQFDGTLWKLTGTTRIDGGLHVGGDSDPGEDNVVVDGTIAKGGANGQATTITHATVQSGAMSGATLTLTNLIPAKSLVLGVTIHPTTAITSGDGATTYAVGDGSDADRWGATVAFAADCDLGNATIASPVYYPAATSVVLTANGGTFSAGVVRATVHYISLTAATS